MLIFLFLFAFRLVLTYRVSLTITDYLSALTPKYSHNTIERYVDPPPPSYQFCIFCIIDHVAAALGPLAYPLAAALGPVTRNCLGLS